MALTIVQHKLNVGSGGASMATSFDTLPAVGNFVVALVTNLSGVAGDVTIADNQSNTWGLDRDGGAAANCENVVGSAQVSTSSGTFTITATATTHQSICAMEIVEISGVVSASAFDIEKAAAANSTTPDTGASSSTTQADEIVLAFFLLNAGVTGVTPDGSYTTLDTGDTSVGGTRTFSAAYLVVSATGAQQASWTYTGSAALWNAALVTYKAAAAAANPTYQMSSAQ